MEGFKTPLPVPDFTTTVNTCYSTKRSRRVPYYRRIGPPPLTAPPARVSNRFRTQKPRRISFTMAAEKRLPRAFYDQTKEESYFKQTFVIEAKIGEGCFGKVFKARSKEDKQLYAVKEAVEPFRNESDRVARLREVQKHESLPKHPNLLRFVKAWEERGCLYIQTELCKISLSELCGHVHDMPESLIWKYLVDLLLAVKHLHDHDLVHMDIKPENILISEDGICKLGDFGLICDLKKDTLTDVVEGDSKYLAPEVLQERIGKHVDIFSLGITILEISSDLDLPSEGETWRLLREGHLPESFLTGRSSELHDVIRIMMTPDETKRPGAAEILALPAVANVWRWRRRYVAYCQIMKTVRSCLLLMWTYFTFHGRSATTFRSFCQLARPRPGNKIAWTLDYDSDAGICDFGDDLQNGNVTRELKLEHSDSDDDSSHVPICDLSAICQEDCVISNSFSTPPIELPHEYHVPEFFPSSPTAVEQGRSYMKEKTKAAVRQPWNSTPANDSRMRRRIIDTMSPNDLKRLRGEEVAKHTPCSQLRLDRSIRACISSDTSYTSSPYAVPDVHCPNDQHIVESSDLSSSRQILSPKNLLDIGFGNLYVYGVAVAFLLYFRTFAMQEPGSPLVPLDPSRFREMVEKQQVATHQQQPQQQLQQHSNIPSSAPSPISHQQQQQQHPLANQYYRENLTRTQSASSVGSVESVGNVALPPGADIPGQFQQRMSPQYSPHIGNQQQRFWYPHPHSSPRAAYCSSGPPFPPPSSSQGSSQQPMTPQSVHTPQSAGSVGSPRMAMQSHTPGLPVMSPDLTQSSPGSARSPMGSPIQGQPSSVPYSQPRLRAAAPLNSNQQSVIYQQQPSMQHQQPPMQHQQSYPPNYQLQQQQEQAMYSPNYPVIPMSRGGGPEQYPRPYPTAVRPGTVVAPQQQVIGRPVMIRQGQYMMYRQPGIPLAGGQLPPNAYQDQGVCRNPSPCQPPQHPVISHHYGKPPGYMPGTSVQYGQVSTVDGSNFANMAPGQATTNPAQRYALSMQQSGKQNNSGVMSPPTQRHPAMAPLTPTYGPPPTLQQYNRPMQPIQYSPAGVNLNPQQPVSTPNVISPVGTVGGGPPLAVSQQPSYTQLPVNQQQIRPAGAPQQTFQHPSTPQQHQLDIAQQRRQPSGFGGGPVANQLQPSSQQLVPRMVHHGAGQIIQSQQQQQQQPQQDMKVQFYGHEPHLNIPPEVCLVGGVFLIVDYDRIIDQKEVGDWRLVITLHGGEVETVYTSKCTHIICESLRHPVVQQALKEGKRCVTAQWLNDCLLQKKLQPPWKAVHFPSPYGDNKPCKNKIFTVCGFDANERSCLKQMIMAVGGRYTSYLSRHNHFLVAKWYSLEDPKVGKALEWKVQIVNVPFLTELFLGQGSVLQNISNPKYHQFLPRDLMRQQQQQNPNGYDPFRIDATMLPPLMSAWRVPITFTSECWKSALERKHKIENDDGKLFPHKKLKLSPAPEDSEIQARRMTLSLRGNSMPRICFTGLYPSEVDNITRKALWLGGEIVTEVKECTHLVACDLKRTQKLLDGITLGRLIVMPLWIKQSYKQQQFVDAVEYLVKDEGNEKFFGFNIKLSIYRARQGKLFQNMAFYVTPSVQPYPSVLRDLVQTASGTVLQQRPPVKRILELQQQGAQFVVITCDNDLHLCQSLLDAGIAIHSAEFILTGILRQEVDFTSYKLEPRQIDANSKSGRDG